jgi:hypothetical protein
MLSYIIYNHVSNGRGCFWGRADLIAVESLTNQSSSLQCRDANNRMTLITLILHPLVGQTLGARKFDSDSKIVV